MSRREKLLERLKSRPKDFSYDELRTLMNGSHCKEIEGKGSRVAFVHETSKLVLRLHKPHPDNRLKQYQLDDVLAFFKQLEGLE